MKHFILSRLGKPGNAVVAALVAVAAIGGWGASTTFGTRAVAVESHYEISAKATLVGSYTVIGTDVDGTSYTGSHTLDSLWRRPAPSSWNGTTASRLALAKSSAMCWRWPV